MGFDSFGTSVLFGSTKVTMTSRFARHLIGGGVGTLLYMGIVAILVELFNLDPVLSVAISFVLLELYTYLINRIWVYESRRTHGYAMPRFLIVAIVALSLNTGVMHLVVDIASLWYGWGLLLTVLLVPPTNFLLNYYWAFK